MKRLFLSFLLAFVATVSVVGCSYIASPEGAAPVQRAIGSITAQGPITATNVTASGVITGAGLLSTANITATTAITAPAITSSSSITALGPITATGITAAGVVSAAGLSSSANITATTAITAPVITSSTSITALGPITATGITASDVVAAAGLSSSANITATSAITAPVITASGGITVTGNDAFHQSGNATTWEDLRIDGLSTRTGVVAPTDEVGFRGSASFYARNFVHNQADEVQFTVQFPHQWREGSSIEPHVHFSPWITNVGDAAVSLVLDCYWADVDDTFPAASTPYTMTKSWNGSKQWAHLIADGPGLSMTGLTLSNLGKCRLYRDNTVANNLAGKITFQYFDIHYEVDSLGSRIEYVK